MAWYNKNRFSNNKNEEERVNKQDSQQERLQKNEYENPQDIMAEEPEDDLPVTDCQDIWKTEGVEIETVETEGMDDNLQKKSDSCEEGFTRLGGEINVIQEEIGSLSNKLDLVLRIVGVRENPKSEQHDRMISEVLNRLDVLSKHQNTVENQQEIIKKQHDSMLKYNDDVLYKIQSSLILEMIGIADQVRMIMENKREDESYDLMQGLQELEESIEASLSNNSVRRYSEADSDDTQLNRRRQTTIGNETTYDSTKDGHFKSVAPGYEWTMPYLVVNSEVKLDKILKENQRPQTFSFVIRPEEVVKLRYRAPKQSDQSDPEVSAVDAGKEEKVDENKFIEFE